MHPVVTRLTSKKLFIKLTAKHNRHFTLVAVKLNNFGEIKQC